MIVVVFGLPGTGKSFFAERLAARINARYINSDRLRKKMFVERTYSEDEKRLVYDEMLTQMYEAMEQNEALVLDATFYKEELRRKFVNQAGNKISFIEVKAEEAIIEERLRAKRKDSEADFAVYQQVGSEFEPMTEPHLVLYSSNDNINQMVDSALTYLKSKNDERTG